MLGVAGEKKPAAQFKDMTALTTYPATVTLGANVQVNVAAKTLATHHADIAIDRNVAAEAKALTLTTHRATIALDTGEEDQPNTAYQWLRDYRAGIAEDDDECLQIASMMLGVSHVVH